MKIYSVSIYNFRKLYKCTIDLSSKTTLFVGANNSGKTSAMDALGKFLADRNFVFNDFTLANHEYINEIGYQWEQEDCEKPESISEWVSILPTMDVKLDVSPEEIHHVIGLIPTLEWREGLLAVRLLYQPRKIEELFLDYREAFFAARKIEGLDSENTKVHLFPKNLCEFLEKKLKTYFMIKPYILDPKKEEHSSFEDDMFEMEASIENPFKGIVRIDMISAQRGFSDPDGKVEGEIGRTKLSTQMRGYYDKHLDPEKLPSSEDIKILSVTEEAKQAFDRNLEEKLNPAIKELEDLGYPGVADPKITIKSKLVTSETLNHDSAVQYALGTKDKEFMLPEKYNGLGYQNLISMVFHLIAFRDAWMRKGKAFSDKVAIEPLHLVLIEEPEAHLHVQVQQVFIRKAYSVLRNHDKLRENTEYTTQLIISTHSSHIAKEEQFSNLRYFKRLLEGSECKVATSRVVNLSKIFLEKKQTDKFATKYLQTTHCDLFFADAVIIVEGAVERTLMPHFIRCHYPDLNQRYISILSINGKHSHKLESLMNALALPVLIITDLDSALEGGHHKKEVPERGKNLISSNYAITGWLIKEKSFDTLLDLPSEKKVIMKQDMCGCDYPIRVAYQTPITIKWKEKEVEAVSRTFEDCFLLSNLELIKNTEFTIDSSLLKKVYNELEKVHNLEDLKRFIFEELQKSSVKEDFALDLIYEIDPDMYVIPSYIQEGLAWLQEVMGVEV